MNFAHDTAADRRLGAAAGGGFRRRLTGAWQAYWEWQRRRTTVRILSSLDERTLKDIGINPSEITSYAYGDPDHRRARCAASWQPQLAWLATWSYFTTASWRASCARLTPGRAPICPMISAAARLPSRPAVARSSPLLMPKSKPAA